MARPREHDLDDLLDHARSIWAREGRAALTIRSLSEAAGMSNGAIYHAFGSRGALLAATWIREADSFILFQGEASRRARTDGGSPADEVVAAALAPQAYAERSPDGARLLLGGGARELAEGGADDSQRRHLRRHRHDLTQLIEELSERLWSRRDAAAVYVVKQCVVDLPSALLLRPRGDAVLARHVLETSVRGVVASPPPAPARRP